jgi:hypothetical protein
MKFEVIYQDGGRVKAPEITFDILCQFEDEFQVSAVRFENELRVSWLSWCLHRALTEAGMAATSYQDWRRTVAEILPLDGEPVNPTQSEVSIDS